MWHKVPKEDKNTSLKHWELLWPVSWTDSSFFYIGSESSCQLFEVGFYWIALSKYKLPSLSWSHWVCWIVTRDSCCLESCLSCHLETLTWGSEEVIRIPLPCTFCLVPSGITHTKYLIVTFQSLLQEKGEKMDCKCSILEERKKQKKNPHCLFSKFYTYTNISIFPFVFCLFLGCFTASGFFSDTNLFSQMY